MPFLPSKEKYEVPGGGVSFMKLEVGKNKIRILSDARIGWEGWIDGKPFRREGIEQNITADEVDIDEKFSHKPKINHFWAFIVYDYADEQVKMFTLTQKTIMKQIQSLVEDEEWGDPLKYDLNIEKSEGKRVTYTVKPYPHAKLSSDVEEALEASELDLDSLFKEAGEDEEVSASRKKANKDFGKIGKKKGKDF